MLPTSPSCRGWVRLDINPLAISVMNFRDCVCTIFFFLDHLPYLLSRAFVPLDVAMFQALFLPIFSHAMVHSSALLLENRVALLLAPDEGGKTTALSLAPRGIPLSDDQNVLQIKDGKITVYPIPWTKPPYPGQSGPLGGMFLLEQGSEFKLAPVKPREVLSYLWGEHEYCSRMLPNPYRQKFFDILHMACNAVPCYRLTFAKDSLDWDAVDRAMNPA